jgi:hypothetical protein
LATFAWGERHADNASARSALKNKDGRLADIGSGLAARIAPDAESVKETGDKLSITP